MAQLTRLSNWLNEQPEQNIAAHKGINVTTVDFLLLVRRWMDVLKLKQGPRWAVYHQDPFEFLAILFALWQLKRIACIPGDKREGTVQELSGYVDGFVGEFSKGVNAVSNKMVELPMATKEWLKLEPDFIALEIYTSGSTGKPKAITKTINQLDLEISAINLLWPARDGCVVITTVTHQHFYGLIFGLLLPFSSGLTFERQRCNFSEDILYYAKYYAGFLLISSPSHLGRMNTALDWGDIGEDCHYILSSTAPLTRVDSLNVGYLLNTSVREIYGSSETGAIAWRSQIKSESEAKWQALPNVEVGISSKGTLNLKSNFLAGKEVIELTDRVSFDKNNLFTLLGREDSIVKIEGKRISLTAIEQRLLTTSLVKQVKAIVLEGRRVEIGTIIQLTDEGAETLSSEGRRSLITILKSVLSPYFESVLLPRKWRFVAQLPFNSQGKLPINSLLELFDKAVHSKNETKWPVILDEVLVDQQCKISICIPSELIYFQGHFTNAPILPGIVQIHWAEAFGRRIFSIDIPFQRLEVIKFQKLIFPNNKLTITLNYDNSKKRLSFMYKSKKGVHSSGRISFA